MRKDMLLKHGLHKLNYVMINQKSRGYYKICFSWFYLFLKTISGD